MPSVLAVRPLAEAAAEAVREGCVAETLAALQASEQLARASDDQVRAALTRIATDEARHAELAYRFVRWAVSVGGAPVRSAAIAAFDAAHSQLMAASESPVEEVDVALWHAHGRLTPSEERACMLAGLRDVIEPCERALLAT
jgi:rubrerythrin